MSVIALDAAARTVLDRFPATSRDGTLTPLGNRGGFSGARLWRWEHPAGPLCLRAWPPDGPDRDRLRWVHLLMAVARDAGLTFVPAVVTAADGATWVEHTGRLWDLTAWMPGRADFHARPTPERLEAACVALARLHGVWAPLQPAAGPCPAVQRRLTAVRAWSELAACHWYPALDSDENLIRPWAFRAWRLVRDWLPRVGAPLEGWAARPLRLQPCLCDLWHDHVLYEGDTVTALLDYGSAKVDHVAADLARLLGSLAGDDSRLRARGLDAYRRCRTLSAEEEALVHVLDRTGTVLGMANWLKWLYLEGRVYEDRAGVARRLAALVERVEQWAGSV
jgi:Ser/Thr protein kinase RdoA (MazF antagonist)